MAESATASSSLQSSLTSLPAVRRDLLPTSKHTACAAVNLSLGVGEVERQAWILRRRSVRVHAANDRTEYCMSDCSVRIE